MKTVDSDVWFGENILYVVVKEGSIIDLSAAQLHLTKWREYLDENEDIKEFVLIVNMKGLRTITREARTFYSKKSEGRSKAVALIIGSPVSRVIANFFLSFNRPEKPIQLFNSGDEAFKWAKKKLSILKIFDGSD